eukprot:75126-Ditylum_brightwellii.AAC.1
MAAIKDVVEHCHAVVKWEDGKDSPITGAPPCIKQLVDIGQIKDHGTKLRAKISQMIMSELKDYLENKGIGGGELTEAKVKEMIDTAAKKFVGALDTKLNHIAKSINTFTSISNVQLDVNNIHKSIQLNDLKKLSSYHVHLFEGKLTWLSDDFEFSNGTAWDC